MTKNSSTKVERKRGGGTRRTPRTTTNPIRVPLEVLAKRTRGLAPSVKDSVSTTEQTDVGREIVSTISPRKRIQVRLSDLIIEASFIVDTHIFALLTSEQFVVGVTCDQKA